MNDVQPTLRCTGLFIPIEILEMNLSMAQQHMLAYIDGLYSEEHGGCFASNEWFAKKFKLKENTIRIIIYDLIKLGLVERVSFNGRQRIIRACKENWFKMKSQSQADCDLNHRQGVIKITGRPLLKSQAPIYRDNSLDNSIETYPNPQSGKPTEVGIAIEENRKLTPRQKGTNPKSKGTNPRDMGTNPRALGTNPRAKKLISHGDYVQLTEEEHKTFCDTHGKQAIDSLIEEMNDYCLSSRPKGYADYAAAIRTWLRKRKIISPQVKRKFAPCSNKQRAMEAMESMEATAL